MRAVVPLALFAVVAMPVSTFAQVCQAPPPGLVRYWPADGSTGDVASSATTTTVGAVGFGTGVFGQAFHLNGGHLESTPLGLTTGTVEFWVNPDRHCCDLRLFSQTSGPTTLGGATSIAFANQGATSWVWNGSSWIRLTPGNPVLAGIWTHLAFVYQNDQVTLYVNGAVSGTGSSRFDFATSGLGIGARFLNTHGVDFAGRIDEFSVYDRPLSAAEIAMLANSALGSKCVTPPDTTSPIVSVPGPIVVEATSAAGASVDYSASATDDVEGDVAATCHPPSHAIFAVGAHPVTCSATDAAGNVGTATFTVTVVDTTPPAFVGAPADTVVEATSSAGAEFIVNATAYDVVSGYLSASCAPGPQYSLGTTAVACTATDAAGNATTAALTITVVDTVPPTPLLNDVHAIATDPAGAMVEFTAMATDIVDGNVAAVCSPTSGTAFAIGATTVTCTAADAAGNGVSTSFTVFVADGVPPIVTPPAAQIIEATSADGAVAAFEATATDNIDEIVTTVCVPASGSQFPIGTSRVDCSATDAANNSASANTSITVRDTTPPKMPLRDVIATIASGTTTIVDFTFNAFDIVDGPVAPVCEPASGSAFPVGVTPVSCTAADAAGNTAASGFVVRLNDGAAPVLTVPPDFSIEATASTGVAPTFEVTASDNIDPSVSVLCSPASGDTLPLGTIQVSCQSTDLGGNTGSANFLITVVDSTPPALVIPPSVTASAETAAGVDVNFTASAVDLVDGSRTVSCSPASGSTFSIGDTAVTCSTSDSRGNSISGSFVVTVTLVANQISRFVAFSTEQTWLRARSTVLSGDVGANVSIAGPHGYRDADDDGERDHTVEVRIGEHVKMLQAGSRVVGDTVWLRANASVRDVHYNELINRRATVLGTTATPIDLPYLAMPAFPTITPGTSAITAAKNATMTLPAGRYARVQVKQKGTLILPGGIYEMVSLDIDQDATVLFRGPTELRITTELDTDAKSKMILDQSVSGLNATQILVYVAGGDHDCQHEGSGPDGDNAGKTVVHIGQQNVIQANIYAPNGSVWLKARTHATGAFVGQRVRIGEKVELSLANGLR